MCFLEWIWPTNRYDSFRNEFLSQRYDQPFSYDYDNLFGSAIRFYRRMLIETDGRTKVGHPERQGKIPHCGVENARNDHQGSSNGGILPCNHLFSMIMIYISEWPSSLFNDILSCIERWCTFGMNPPQFMTDLYLHALRRVPAVYVQRMTFWNDTN